MSIVFWGVTPHPPLLIPEVGGTARGRIEETVRSMEAWAKACRESGAQRLILISPHAPANIGALPIFALPTLRGSMARFGHPEVAMEWAVDLKLVSEIRRACLEEDFPLLVIDPPLAKRYQVEGDIDHGAFVPLYFLERAGLHVPLVLMGYVEGSCQEYARLGRILGRLLEAEGEPPTAIVASGDLSHRLVESGPYGFHPAGPQFDEHLTQALRQASLEKVLALPKEEVQGAGQCGLNSISLLLGSMEGRQVSTHFLSYEGPYGVGYALAYYLPQGAPAPEASAPKEEANPPSAPPAEEKGEAQEGPTAKRAEATRAAKEVKEAEDARVELARRSVEHYVRYGKPLELKEGEYPQLQQPAAVFVTLKEDGDLRGCIGSLIPTRPTQAQEILENAISACSRDPRFTPVREEELPRLHYQVSVLSALQPVKGWQDLDPKRYGVLVRKGGRSGVLLPNLEGVDTVEVQLGIACRKGGILWEEKPDLYRFTTQTYGEEG